MENKGRKKLAQHMSETKLRTNGLLDRKSPVCVLCQGIIADSVLLYEVAGMCAHVECVDKELEGK